MRSSPTSFTTNYCPVVVLGLAFSGTTMMMMLLEMAGFSSGDKFVYRGRREAGKVMRLFHDFSLCEDKAVSDEENRERFNNVFGETFGNNKNIAFKCMRNIRGLEKFIKLFPHTKVVFISRTKSISRQFPKRGYQKMQRNFLKAVKSRLLRAKFNNYLVFDYDQVVLRKDEQVKRLLKFVTPNCKDRDLIRTMTEFISRSGVKKYWEVYG